MSAYQKRRYIKVEFKDEHSGESRVDVGEVDHCDEKQEFVFGTLDSQPVFTPPAQLASN